MRQNWLKEGGAVLYKIMQINSRPAKHVMEYGPYSFEDLQPLLSIEQIIPLGSPHLKNMPWLILCIGVSREVAVACCQDLNVSTMYAQMQDGNVVVYRRQHVNLFGIALVSRPTVKIPSWWLTSSNGLSWLFPI